jgi:hypothetical protein
MSDATVAGLVIGLLALPVCAAGIWGMRQQTHVAARLLGIPVTAPKTAFLGGALTRTVTATWPLARLELFTWGIRLGASARLLQLLPLSLPTWEARYGELGVVRRVTSHGTEGLRFAVTGATDAVVFWSFRCPEILDQLEIAGATVDRTVTSLKKAGGIYDIPQEGPDRGPPRS